MESIVGMTDSMIMRSKKASQEGHNNSSGGNKNERSASTSSATSSSSYYQSSRSPPISPKNQCQSQVLVSITNTNSNNVQSDMVSSTTHVPQTSCSVYQVDKSKKETDEKLTISNEKRKTVKELLSQFETTKANIQNYFEDVTLVLC